MRKLLSIFFCLALALSASAQTRKSAMKKAPAGPAPDAALMQKIWDGWQTLNPANAAQYYATGPHVFFDIAPLKYDSLEEYQKGAAALLSNYKSAKFTVDSPEIHPHGDLAWATALVKSEMTNKSGKVDMGNFRWTVIWSHESGKWLIIHEHISAPLQ